jgi:hypothetical protein
MLASLLSFRQPGQVDWPGALVHNSLAERSKSLGFLANSLVIWESRPPAISPAGRTPQKTMPFQELTAPPAGSYRYWLRKGPQVER